MKNKSLIQFFANGFSLTNHSLDLWLINLSFNTLTSSFLNLKDKITSQNSILFLIIPFCTLLLNLSYNLSLPIFLQQKLSGKKLNYQELFKVVVTNAKRIVLPVIVLLVLFMMFVLLLALFIMVFFNPSTEYLLELKQYLKNSDGNPFFVLSTILLSLFTFTPFFYSLENITLLTSLKKSVVMAFKNSRFIIVIVFINIVIGFLRSLIQANFLFRNIFGTLLISYINLIITASALFYYQSHDTIHIPPKR